MKNKLGKQLEKKLLRLGYPKNIAREIKYDKKLQREEILIERVGYNSEKSYEY